jgi:hypothetical protein
LLPSCLSRDLSRSESLTLATRARRGPATLPQSRTAP